MRAASMHPALRRIEITRWRPTPHTKRLVGSCDVEFPTLGLFIKDVCILRRARGELYAKMPRTGHVAPNGSRSYLFGFTDPDHFFAFSELVVEAARAAYPADFEAREPALA